VALAIALLSKTPIREGVSSDRGASNGGILTGIHVFRQQAIIGAVKSNPGSPMTLGNAAAARVRWCKDGRHQIEPDPTEMAQAVRAWPVRRIECFYR
jgi:hypothetical protein